MTSHLRHRRGLPFPDLIEPGELAVDPVNRQLTAGNIDAAAGVKVPLLAIRFFDPAASYVINDYVVYGGVILRATGSVPPGAFDPTDWEVMAGITLQQQHTPLHGYGDGASHTLLLHHTTNDNTLGNTIDFLNLASELTAKLFTTGLVGDKLRIQSSGSIALAPSHIGFDDGSNVLEVTPGVVYVYGSIDANGNLTLATNAIVMSRAGFLHLQGQTDLYLRSGTGFVHINDTGGPTDVGGTLWVAGAIAGSNGATFANDVRVYRSSAPTTGLVSFGDGSHYLYYNGSDLEMFTMRARTLDPVDANHVATKGYVDAHLGAGIYLPLLGGTMLGPITSAPSDDMLSADVAGSFCVMGSGGGNPWSIMSFWVPPVVDGVPAASVNFGFNVDGNFYMGGGSHTSNTYKFLTSREVPLTPPSDLRLVHVADVGLTGSLEPYSGAVVTGITTTTARFRYLQKLIGSTWFTVGTVGP